KILIIDDEESIVKFLSLSLKADGYETVTAYNGKQGLEVFKKEQPDIVLTDIKMPEMDGLEVLRQIKMIDSESEVIIITGHGDIDSTIAALQRGASDFINKPVRDEALAVALKRAEAKIYMRGQLNEYTGNLEDKIEEATQEINRRSNFQQLLIRSSNDGIAATDKNWKFVICNPEAEKIFGCKYSDLVDKIDIETLYPSDIAQAFKKAAKENQDENLEWKESSFLSKDGRNIPIKFSGRILYQNDKMIGSVAFFQDLTDIKRLEKELVQSEKLAAVGQTVSGLAHYIKNILIGLKGGSYVVDVGIAKNKTDKLIAGWSTIKNNIGRVSDLVQDLISFSKEREPEYKTCSPNDIVTEVVDLIKDFANANNIKITKKLDPAIKEASMDTQTIHRSLLNLITNAMDACLDDPNTDKNFKIAIKTYPGQNNLFCVDVKDNGSGMTDETKEKLFTSFFSTKGGRGTGLGLLLTKKLIEEHNGIINVKTNLGKGTTFTIKLPYEKAKTKIKKSTKEN
ncbi:MAG: response regulator, partial [Desulfobacteraceae bacterium]|nr:response regulator [Desulfobacteraceae bacterium]